MTYTCDYLVGEPIMSLTTIHDNIIYLQNQSDISDTENIFQHELHYYACRKHYAALHLWNKIIVATSAQVVTI